VSQIAPGTLVSLDLNADTDLAGAARTQIYGLSFTPGCQLVTTLEIIDNITQKTVVVIGSRQTYPFVSTARAMEASQSAESPGR
jgi:hypothetical protein